MAAGVQKRHLAWAVPLISPFELQHQIFREHPASEQLFLIATSQHCCPCLYINTYTVPRTEHQSPALLPPPLPGRASPAAGPSTAACSPWPGRRVAVPGRAPDPAVPLPLCGVWLDAPVPCECPLLAPGLPVEVLGEERGHQHAFLAGRSSPHLQQHPGLPPVALPPSHRSPGRAWTAPPRCCLSAARLWRPWAKLAEMQRDGLEGAEGGGQPQGGRVLECSNPTAA